MKKYFYLSGSTVKGPFTLEELKEQNITRSTKVWFFGLDQWTIISEIDELKSITDSIPPPLKNIENNEKRINQIGKIHTHEGEKHFINIITLNNKIKLGYVFIIFLITILFIIITNNINKNKEKDLYNKISESSYPTNFDIDFYIDKFYRDVEFFGIFPKRPSIKIVRFAKFDQIENATHYHAVSYGMNDDDRIEIYINQNSWDSFNKPKRYYLIYHELAHDVLNLPDLQNLPSNKGKLMYPEIASYESITMDDFIENCHSLFEELALKNSHK